MFTLTPPVVFVIFLVLSVLFGLGAMKFAPKGSENTDAETSYAGGEDIPGGKKFPGYKVFFPIALFFTILHVMALLLGLLPKGSANIGLVFAGIICVTLLLLYIEVTKHE